MISPTQPGPMSRYPGSKPLECHYVETKRERWASFTTDDQDIFGLVPPRRSKVSSREKPTLRPKPTLCRDGNGQWAVIQYSIVVEPCATREAERVVRNVGENIHRICSGSRAGCTGTSSQATRLPLQDHPAVRVRRWQKNPAVRHAFPRARGNSRVASRVPSEVTIH
jgi:hypothetical protein